MLGTKSAADAGIYLLADHLDTALAVGEDLLAQKLPPPKDWPQANADGRAVAVGAVDQKAPFQRDPLAAFVARIDNLEASLLARVLQARRRSIDLPRLDPELRTLMRLFSVNTEMLGDVIARFGDDTGLAAEAGGDPYLFLRSRGVIAENAASIPDDRPLEITEDYRVAAIVELGSLLNLVSSVLDVLDVRYDLYADGLESDAGEDAAAVAVPQQPLTPPVNDAPKNDSALTPKSLAEALAAIDRPR